MSVPPPLAIVIPAYKPHFLSATLASVAAQTDQRFRLYVGDDAGPSDIEEICSAHVASGGKLTYRRFERNLGRASLTDHWNRCVGLTKEPWVWLFSDDDLMLPGCVASIHQALEQGVDADVLRFNTDVVDETGNPISTNPRHPARESGADFLYERLLGRRQAYVVEWVFRREAFDAVEGFPPYPLAWGADYAALYLFSRRKGIRTLTGGTVRYRKSPHSISGAWQLDQGRKIEATLKFLGFVEREVVPEDTSGRSREDWRRATEHWFLGQVHYLLPVGPSVWLAILRASGAWWRRRRVARLWTLTLWNVHQWILYAWQALRAPRDPTSS